MANIRQINKKNSQIESNIHGSTQAIISSVNSENETFKVQGKPESIQIGHSFCTNNSWIRSIPTSGTRVTLTFNQSTNKYDFVAYVPNNTKSIVAGYNNKTNMYRSLEEGEHEIKSSGDAVSYWGSRCYMEHRAGCVQTVLDGENLKHITKAPTVLIRDHNHRSDEFNNEIRFGVVTRPLTNTQENIVQKSPSSDAANDSFNYAYEMSAVLSNDLNNKLFDFRLGEVYEDVPLPGYPFSNAVLGNNKLPLRADLKYYSTIEPTGIGTDDFSEIQVDCLGNINKTLANTAVIGFVINVPKGGYKLSTGLQCEIDGTLGVALTSSNDISLDGKTGVSAYSASNVNISGDEGVTIKSKVNIELTADSNVIITSTGKTTVKGEGGVSIIGALGESGRPIATLPYDPICGVPLFTDASVHN